MKKTYISPDTSVMEVQVQALMAASLNTGVYPDKDVDASDSYSLFDEPFWDGGSQE